MIKALQMTRNAFRFYVPFYHGGIIDIMKFSDFDELAGGCLALNVVTVQNIQANNNRYVQRGSPNKKRVLEHGNPYARHDNKYT